MMYKLNDSTYVYPRILRDVIEYRVPYLIVSMDLPFNLNSDVIIDIETTGLNPGSAIIISYGYAIKDKANVITLAYGRILQFESFCKGFTKLLKELGFKLWAWNHSFEAEFLDIDELDINELQLRPFEKKDSSLQWGFNPPTNGKEVPKLWREWRKYGDVKALWKIALRNLYDVTIEAASLARRPVYEVINHD